MAAQDFFEITSEAIQGIAPGISLIYDQSLENSECAGFGLLLVDLDKTRQNRHIAKGRLVRYEPADFYVGIEAFTNATKELQDKPVTVNDGGVALLASQHRRLQGSLRVARHRVKHLGRVRLYFGVVVLKTSAVSDARKQRFAEARIVQRVVEQSFRLKLFTPDFQLCDYRLGVGLA